MARYVTAEPLEEVPEDEQVTDFDELSARRQDRLLQAIDGEYVSGTVGGALDGRIVRYTDYYEVRVGGIRASD